MWHFEEYCDMQQQTCLAVWRTVNSNITYCFIKYSTKVVYDTVYLTAIGLTPGGSNTCLHTNNTKNNTNKKYIGQHIIDAKQYIEQHNSLIWKNADRVPSLRSITWHLPYNWRKSMGKPQSG